jgi:hypothetical protein
MVAGAQLCTMQSLRTRRPSDPPKRHGSKLAKAPSARRRSAVDDKMKKRMSLRYAISAPTDAPVPAVPTIPLGLRPGPRDPDAIVLAREDPRLLDQRLLDGEDFDPDGCASPPWPHVPLTSTRRPQGKARQLDRGRAQVPPVLPARPQGRHRRRAAAQRLQKVSAAPPRTPSLTPRSYAEFVLVSKEISVLENEMHELKECLQEWKSMPSLLHIDESASVAGQSPLPPVPRLSLSQNAGAPLARPSWISASSMPPRCRRSTRR